MASPSLVQRPPEVQHAAPAAPATPSAESAFARILARVKALLDDRSDHRIAQLVAGKVFMVRVASALLALGSQVLLARWMGSFEYGVFIYVWTWVLMIGALSDMGLASAAKRFIPEYAELKSLDELRGFLIGSRRLAFAIASTLGAAGALIVWLARDHIDSFSVVPLYIACAGIPIYGLVQTQAGIAESYDWTTLALAPFYLWRQLALTLLMGAAWALGAPTGAVTALLIAVGTIWIVTIGQGFALDRRLGRAVVGGPRRYAVKTWIGTALPMFMVDSCYLLLTYVDILALEHLRSPDEVAIYYAAARLLAIVAFVYFAIAGATTHKFTRYYVARDAEQLSRFFRQTMRWTFWPSLAACAGMLAFGRPLLSLFGRGFESGYAVMFILALGMLARAAVGPAERLLSMLGDRAPCAAIYAAAFVLNLALCVVLIPRLGIEGAAAATSTALAVESALLYRMARRRLSHHLSLMRHSSGADAQAS